MTRLRLFLALSMLLGCVLGWGGGRSADAQELVPPTGTPISLSVSKGTLIRLEHDADTVFVANPAVADVMVKTPRLIYLYAKAPGETSLYAVDAQQHVLIARPVSVKRDLARLQGAINQLLPDDSVDVKAVDDSIVLAGHVRSPRDAEEIRRIARPFVGDDKELVNHVRVEEPNQINLRVRVVEVSRSVIKELGINWDAIAHAGAFAFGLATGNPVLGVLGTSGTTVVPGFNPYTGIGVNNTYFTTQNPGPAGSVTNSLFGGYNTSTLSVDSLIDALSQNGLVTILAEPNLTAISGETASFLAGGEFPIPIPQGNQVTTIEFKSFGVALAFTPVVLDSGRISLRVRPEVSQLSTTGALTIQGYTVPALSTRRAETTVELGSGQSFAIGGLLQNNITDTLKKVPGLGDVPVLGPLFRSSQFQRNESELVILVTPYLVRPVSERRLAGPADGMRPPTDTDLWYRGRDTQPAAPAGGSIPLGREGGGLIGPSGFILN